MQLEHELILAHILDVDRSFFITHPHPILTDGQQKKFDHMCALLNADGPLPYILGYKEFYARRFHVNKHTLIPRPETELFIDCIRSIAHKNTTIIDVGTGSGCIAITAALETHARMIATDISNDTLEIAKKNARTHHADITFHQGNLLEPVRHEIENAQHLIICANLPYIPTNEYQELPKDLKAEPRLALDGGTNGMDYYKEMFAQLQSYSHPQTHVLCEIMPDQTEHIRQCADAMLTYTRISFHKDLTNRPRIAHILTREK